MSRQELHTLIDTVDEKEIDFLYTLLLKFIPSDKPLPDEVEVIKNGEEDYKKGNIFLMMRYGNNIFKVVEFDHFKIQ